MLHHCVHDRSSVGSRTHWGRDMARSAVGPDAVHTVQRSHTGVNQGFCLPGGADRKCPLEGPFYPPGLTTGKAASMSALCSAIASKASSSSFACPMVDS